VYAYSQQANLSIERDLGKGFALNLAYNFNGGRHLNRPINANTVRGDLMMFNLRPRRPGLNPFGISSRRPEVPDEPVYSWDFERLSSVWCGWPGPGLCSRVPDELLSAIRLKPFDLPLP